MLVEGNECWLSVLSLVDCVGVQVESWLFSAG